ncbi:hypothetical protein PDE_04091 [Penicillium oxalicum 114-2]|uniref:MOSC domain-containing protein n=1 Tax=Penicillium oxalicum (strain 114-2 / CGMCC 5302) TaxID=933388 RepID=S8B3N7_PENO1|nr:hypothetical protein PDE_04091 [Penicillium oxalicum 114-2]
MKISELYIYPIKSLRPTKVTEGELTHLGFKYDRRFMLIKVTPGENGGPSEMKNMHISSFPEMSLFQTTMETSQGAADPGKIVVTYSPPSLTTPGSDQEKVGNQTGERPPVQGQRPVHANSPQYSCQSLEIPLEPDTTNLKPIDVTMHRSPTTGYDMGEKFNSWFSDCFGFPVILTYLGENTRGVLGTLAPKYHTKEPWWRVWQQEFTMLGGNNNNPILGRWLVPITAAYLLLNAASWAYAQIEAVGLSPVVGICLIAGLFLGTWAGINTMLMRRREARIGFADCAPFLVVSQTSVDDVSARLAGTQGVDLTKFRPNIVVTGAVKAFEEDFWAELGVGKDGLGKVKLLVTGHCVRCRSLNIDFKAGKFSDAEDGNVLKKLMKDRRVDQGARFSPVFGRYSFPGREAVGKRIKVGDEVWVLKRAKKHTVTDWPGSSY